MSSQFVHPEANQIQNYFVTYFESKSKEKLSPESVKGFQDFTNSQIQIEKNYTSETKICYDRTSDLSGLNKDELILKLQTELYDINVMNSMKCIVDLIINPKGPDGKLSEKERIHEWVRNPKRFGSPSVNGYAIRSDISDTNTYTGDTIVLKCPQDSSKSTELVHEVAVGFTLNPLREFIPNFSFVYDVFSCSSPVVDPNNKEILLFCVNDINAVAYAAYENINNSVPFEDWVTVTDTTEFILYYLQVLLSLSFAHKKCDFTHYDCHAGNVLIRKYSDESFYLPYEHRGQTVYLLSLGGIATFIDYGMSHVQIKENINVGLIDPNGNFAQRYDVYPDRSFVISDAYKLLGFMIAGAINARNNNLILVGSKLLEFFYGPLTIEETIQIITKQIEYYFFLPEVFPDDIAASISARRIPGFLSSSTRDLFPIEDFIDHVMNVYSQIDAINAPLLFTYNKPDVIFGCRTNCKTAVQDVEEIGLGLGPVPTFFEVFDARNEFDNKKIINNLATHFDNALEQEKTELHAFLNYSASPVYSFPKFRTLEESYNFLNISFDLLSKGIDDIAVTYQTVFNLETHSKIITYLLSLPELKAHFIVLNELNRQIVTKNNNLKRLLAQNKYDVYRGLIELKNIRQNRDDKDDIIDLINRYERVYTDINTIVGV